MDLDARGQTRLDEFVTDHECLQAMPESSMRILKLLEDPNCRMDHLVKLARQDAAIAARMIKTVNSAAYARSNRITQLDRAVAYLGLRVVKEIAVATAVSVLCKPVMLGKYAAQDLWDHSLAVAVLSRELALRCKVAEPESAFVAGILHDVGLLVSAQSEPDTAREVFDDVEDADIPFTAVEEKYFGFDHCQFGGRLSQAWNFPEQVAAVARWHHAPQESPSLHRQLCTMVWIADTLCAQASGMFSLTCLSQKISDRQLADCNLDREETVKLAGNLKVLLRLHVS